MKRKKKETEIKESVLLREIEKYFAENEEIVVSCECDLSANSYGNSLVCALWDSLCVLKEDGSFIRRSYSEISDIYVRSYVASGEIIIVSDDEEIPVSQFTLARSGKVEQLVNTVRKFVNGESVDKDSLTPVKDKDFSYMNKGRKKLFMRVMSYVPKYKKHLYLMIGLIVLATLVNLVRPYITGTLLYDEVLSETGKYSGRIIELVLLLVGVSALSVFFGILQGRIGADMSGKIIYDIKTEVFTAMQKHGMEFFTSKRTGNLLNRVNNDALDIQYFLNDGLPNFIINAATIASVGLFLFVVNPLLSVTVLIPIPLIAFIVKKSLRTFKRLKWHTWRRSSSMNSTINDTLMGVRVVKAFGKEDREIERFQEKSSLLYENKVREGVASAKVFPLLSWIMALGGLMVWGLGGAQVISGKLSFGELMSFVGYLSLLYSPVNFMVKTFEWFTSCMNSAQRIFEVVDREASIKEAENPVEKGRLNGVVELKNVTFSYEPNRTVLKNVSFKVSRGEMIGLVGHSGAGKSTITNIITRLYDVNDGEVLIDGINVKNLSFRTLRSNIGMVLQETFLFTGTIAENISYGNPEASIDMIVDAAKKAHAHEFITNLPDGYQTIIGENSVNLSGGEKQRISIARAILMDPAILIFDEATASLDTKTEQHIQEAMETLIKGRTTIAIAHRFSTLKNADRLVVVEEGCIVEEGTHEELFHRENGIYASMAKKQMDAINLRKGVVENE